MVGTNHFLGTVAGEERHTAEVDERLREALVFPDAEADEAARNVFVKVEPAGR